MSEWPKLQLQQVAEVVGRGISPVYSENDGVLVLNQKCVRDGRVLIEQARRHDASTRSIPSKKLLTGGEVLINSTGVGTLGRTAFVGNIDAPMTVDSHVTIVRASSGIHPRWLGYALRNLEPDIEALAIGSTGQTELGRSLVCELPIKVPPLADQRAIAGVLGALDNKIDLNRKIAFTLREYGQALLLQIMLLNSTLVSLHSVVKSVARGVAPSYMDDGVSPLVLNQRCVRNGRVELSAARRMAHRTVAPERLAELGDILVNSTGTGTLGRVARWSGNTVFVDGHVSVVKPDIEKFPPTVLAYLLLSCQSAIEELAEGSTGQTELSPKRLLDFQLSMPTANAAEKVEVELLDLEIRGEKALQESDVLATLREALLPELLSGRLRVKDAESMMENV